MLTVHTLEGPDFLFLLVILSNLDPGLHSHFIDTVSLLVSYSACEIVTALNS